ncbi:MAG: hypothetical protein ACI8XB_001805, partial [Patiriisocius sp.]
MRKLSLLSLLGLLVLISCKRDDPEFIGPSLANVFGPFDVLEDFDITDRQVDFLGGESTTFTAIFSKEVDWEVHITGLETGGVKSIAGFGSVLDASNALWNGTTTSLPLFNIETCAVELRIPSDTILILDTLEVISNRVADGFIIADFEDGMINAGWTGFVQSGADMSFNITDDVVPGQGNKYYDMGGEVDWDWLIGLIDFPATAYGADAFDLNPNPGAVYFNVMLYLPPNINNELVLFQFREDDNGDGFYTENVEDMFSIELNNDLEPGWQLISVRYADLQTLVNGAPAAPLGNGLYEPNKLSKISVLFLANPSSGYSQTLMDYLIFTE